MIQQMWLLSNVLSWPAADHSSSPQPGTGRTCRQSTPWIPGTPHTGPALSCTLSLSSPSSAVFSWRKLCRNSSSDLHQQINYKKAFFLTVTWLPPKWRWSGAGEPHTEHLIVRAVGARFFFPFDSNTLDSVAKNIVTHLRLLHSFCVLTV